MRLTARPLAVRPRARRDLLEIGAHLHRESAALSQRFLAAVRLALERLRRTPRIGRVRQFESPRLAGVRSWPVEGFRSHLVFYRHEGGVLHVLRVLHAARDIEEVLEDETR
jgi:toxin ParE1/3/4